MSNLYFKDERKESFLKGFSSFIEKTSSKNEVVKNNYLDLIENYSVKKEGFSKEDLNNLSCLCIRYLRTNCFPRVKQNNLKSCFVGEIPKYFSMEEQEIIKPIIADYQKIIMENNFELILEQSKEIISSLNN